MMNQTFVVRVGMTEVWKVVFNDRVLSPDWRDKTGAETALDLLQRGKGEVTEAGNIRWRPCQGPK